MKRPAEVSVGTTHAGGEGIERGGKIHEPQEIAFVGARRNRELSLARHVISLCGLTKVGRLT